jgi:putative endonuclease
MSRRDAPARAITTQWIVYILECSDKTLYTGITTDMTRRMAAHAAGRGAKYLKRRGPFIVRYRERHLTRSAALKREAAIKSLSRSGKLGLIARTLRPDERSDNSRPT